MNLHRIALILIVLFIIQVFFSSSISHYVLTMYDKRFYAEFTLRGEMVTIIASVVSATVNILLAFWIYRKAKAEGSEPLSWSALTLFFGLLAVILFYLDIIYRQLKADTR
jgi:hypothetical protein